MISARTKAALAAAKRRGVKLGGYRGGKLTHKARQAGWATVAQRADQRAADLGPILSELKGRGIVSREELARALSERRIPTARGKSEWSAVQVQRVLARID